MSQNMYDNLSFELAPDEYDEKKDAPKVSTLVLFFMMMMIIVIGIVLIVQAAKLYLGADKIVCEGLFCTFTTIRTNRTPTCYSFDEIVVCPD